MSQNNTTSRTYAASLIVILKYGYRWLMLTIPLAACIGSVVALFLWLLSVAILFRFHHTWLLYLLPLAGIGIHFSYKLYGKSSEKGNNLIIDEIHLPGAGVPKQMGPLILFTTVITHLFGGSAGREGTAVQIGGSLANAFGSWYKLDTANMQTILTAGIAASFGAVFGTPLAGAIFAMEVLTIGRINCKPWFPCLIAGFIGNLTVSAWHVKHTAYHIDYVAAGLSGDSGSIMALLFLLLKILASSVLFGLVGTAFAETTHIIRKTFLKMFKQRWLIPVLGGLIIIVLTFIVGKPDYLSLGIEPEYPGAITIVSAFQHHGADAFSWFWKFIYTTITLGTGFKGGEVTPLFYIGATLGNTLAGLMNAPVSLFAALGFIAVFSGATNTPLACTVMGAELFGPEHLLLFAVACFTSYFFSGRSGIYTSQLNGAALLLHGNKKLYLKEKLLKYKIRL